MQDRCHLTLIVWYGLCSLLNNLIVPHVYLHQYLFFLHIHTQQIFCYLFLLCLTIPTVANFLLLSPIDIL
jgi:hypothetical protein